MVMFKYIKALLSLQLALYVPGVFVEFLQTRFYGLPVGSYRKKVHRYRYFEQHHDVSCFKGYQSLPELQLPM